MRGLTYILALSHGTQLEEKNYLPPPVQWSALHYVNVIMKRK